jgi:hypothetical protein
MGISIGQFAEKVGANPRTVYRRIESRRLTVLPDGTLDPIRGSIEWLENAIPRGRQKKAISPVIKEFAPAPPAKTTDSPSARKTEEILNHEYDYAAARAKKETMMAELSEIQLQEKQGSVITRANAETTYGKIADMIQREFVALADKFPTMQPDIYAILIKLSKSEPE